MPPSKRHPRSSPHCRYLTSSPCWTQSYGRWSWQTLNHQPNTVGGISIKIFCSNIHIPGTPKSLYLPIDSYSIPIRNFCSCLSNWSPYTLSNEQVAVIVEHKTHKQHLVPDLQLSLWTAPYDLGTLATTVENRGGNNHECPALNNTWSACQTAGH